MPEPENHDFDINIFLRDWAIGNNVIMKRHTNATVSLVNEVLGKYFKNAPQLLARSHGQ